MPRLVDVTVVLAELRERLLTWLGADRTQQRVKRAGHLYSLAVRSAVTEPAWLGRRRRRQRRRGRTAYAPV